MLGEKETEAEAEGEGEEEEEAEEEEVVVLEVEGGMVLVGMERRQFAGGGSWQREKRVDGRWM